jgi:hypothetical protein
LGGSSPEGSLEPDEITVRVRHEELRDPGVLGAYSVPGGLGFHEERVVRLAERDEDRVKLRDGDLEVDSPAEGRLKGSRDPVAPTPACSSIR